MAFAKGMTNREWLIHEKARCLHYLLESVMKDAEDMRKSLIENIARLAEDESDGDPEIRKERESYYLNVFNTAIPDDMENTFLQSMIVQICTYIESILKDIAQDKRQDASLSKIESYYNHIQTEKSVSLGPITDYLPDWVRLHKMRNDITHDGYTSEKITSEYIEQTIKEAENFLLNIERVQ